MRGNKQRLQNIFFFVLGFFWIILFIYFRIIKKKSFYELQELKNSLTNYIVFYNICYILLHFILLLFSFFVIFKKEKKTSSFFFLDYYKKSLKIWITTPIEKVRDLISPHLPGSGLFYCKMGEFLEKNIEFRTKILIMFFGFLPRIIVACIFFIELVFYNKIEIFLYSILLLIIPLFWNIFVNLFTNFGERGLIDIPKYVKITGTGNDLGNGWYSSYKIEPLPQYQYEENELKEWSDTWFMAINIYTFGETFLKGFKNKLSPYVTIISSSFYLSASIYQLLYILF